MRTAKCLNTKIHVLACQPGMQLSCDSLFSEMSVSNFTQNRAAGKTGGMVRVAFYDTWCGLSIFWMSKH